MALASSIFRTPAGYYEIRLCGRLHRPHWVVQLLAALSNHQVSILSGEATHNPQGDWNSLFVLDFSHSAADPQKLNYPAFCEQTVTGDRVTPRLTRFDLSRRTDFMLDLKLEGPDQIGFLASILSRVSILSLFPQALKIETLHGQIRDALVLRGISDRGPSDAAYQTLERMLRSFIAL